MADVNWYLFYFLLRLSVSCQANELGHSALGWIIATYIS